MVAEQSVGLSITSMKICVYGLWHLGTVTAACLANRGFEVVGLDPNTKTIDDLNCGKAPLYEPGLDKHLESGLEAGRLTFTTDIKSAVGHTDIVWVTFDTPIDEDEKADIDFVFDRIIDTFSYLRDDTMIIISSQLPVGSIRKVEREFMECKSDRRVSFCCIPENLRLGQAIESFLNPDRIVVGIRDNGMRPIIGRLLSPISSELVWVGVESAEMSKHALNAFLAMSIVYSNEIAGICERVNADSIEVENTLRTESRVGRSAYIRPGEAFSGGTLARDVTYLTNIADQENLQIPVLNSVVPSNNIQKGWLFRRAQEILGNSAQHKKVGVLGLSYKIGTDSIEKSISIELIRDLLTLGVQISAFDPKVNILPKDLSMVRLENSIDDVTVDADLLILATRWPDFQALSSETLINNMRAPVVIDQGAFLASGLSGESRIQYITFGKG